MRTTSGSREEPKGEANGLAYSVPDEALGFRELRVFGEVQIARHRFLVGEAQVRPSAGYFVDLHLSAPNPFSHRFDGRRRELVERPGDLSVVPLVKPFEVAFGAESEDLNVVLGRGFVTRVAEGFGVGRDDFEVLDRFCVRDPQGERLMLSLLPELGTGGLGGELYVQGLANALAVHLLRRHSSLGHRDLRLVAQEPKPGGLSPRRLAAVLDYVDDNLASELSLGDLAKVANLSAHHFARAFKDSTGLSPHRYVVQERVGRAKGLLAATDLPIAEVALACGFSHQQHLTRHFKGLTGTTPARFRAEALR